MVSRTERLQADAASLENTWRVSSTPVRRLPHSEIRVHLGRANLVAGGLYPEVKIPGRPGKQCYPKMNNIGSLKKCPGFLAKRQLELSRSLKPDTAGLLRI